MEGQNEVSHAFDLAAVPEIFKVIRVCCIYVTVFAVVVVGLLWSWSDGAANFLVNHPWIFVFFVEQCGFLVFVNSIVNFMLNHNKVTWVNFFFIHASLNTLKACSLCHALYLFSDNGLQLKRAIFISLVFNDALSEIFHDRFKLWSTSVDTVVNSAITLVFHLGSQVLADFLGLTLLQEIGISFVLHFADVVYKIVTHKSMPETRVVISKIIDCCISFAFLLEHLGFGIFAKIFPSDRDLGALHLLLCLIAGDARFKFLAQVPWFDMRCFWTCITITFSLLAVVSWRVSRPKQKTD